jgi:hypothetical protein
MSVELMFGGEVELTDGIAHLSGIHLADDSERVTFLVLTHGGMLRGTATAAAAALAHSEGNGLAIACAWAELTAFDEASHPHDPRLILDSTKIRFVEMGSLSQREGEVIGAVGREDLSVEALVVSVEGSTVIVPLDRVEFQSRRWVYVDAVRYPPR